MILKMLNLRKFLSYNYWKQYASFISLPSPKPPFATIPPLIYGYLAHSKGTA
jgi:hypothetical protein